MPALIIILLFALVIVSGILLLNNRFYSLFLKTAQMIREQAERQPSDPVVESDLKQLPLPVAGYIRASGLVGRKRISYMHLTHSGTFSPGSDKPCKAVKGEYFLTTRKPSLCWFGRSSLFPGLRMSALDLYFNGTGKMLVKVLSFFRIVNESSVETALSSFARCIIEMTLIPSFFLDSEKIHWTNFDLHRAACTITDAGLTADAQLYFNPDGTLDSIEVGRTFDRRNGQFSHEKFTRKGLVLADYNGLKIPSAIDGYWNLKGGEIHHIHFVIDKVEFE